MKEASFCTDTMAYSSSIHVSSFVDNNVSTDIRRRPEMYENGHVPFTISCDITIVGGVQVILPNPDVSKIGGPAV
jgi:hypothetical protein